MNAALAGGTVLDKTQARQPARHAQHEVRGNPFGGGERHDAVRIGVVTERCGECDIDAGAGEINGGVECVAAAGQRRTCHRSHAPTRSALRRRRRCGRFARSLIAHCSALRALRAATHKYVIAPGGATKRFPVRRAAVTDWQPGNVMLYCYNMTHHHHSRRDPPIPDDQAIACCGSLRRNGSPSLAC